MSYRNDFLEAFLARKKYIPDAAPEKYFSYKDLMSFNAKKDYSDAYRCYEIMERDFLEYYIPHREKNGLPIAHACHVVAYDMLQWMIKIIIAILEIWRILLGMFLLGERVLMISRRLA